MSDIDLRREIMMLAGWLTDHDSLTSAEAEMPLSQLVARIYADKANIDDSKRALIAVTLARHIEAGQDDETFPMPRTLKDEFKHVEVAAPSPAPASNPAPQRWLPRFHRNPDGAIHPDDLGTTACASLTDEQYAWQLKVYWDSTGKGLYTPEKFIDMTFRTALAVKVTEESP